MNLSCISFIPRAANLNSGNITLGILFGNVIIGPEIGNIGVVIHNLGNPTFDPGNKESLKSAMKEAIYLNKSGKGNDNQKYALTHWPTQIIAEKHFKVYMSTNTKIDNSNKATYAE